ncbi:MAG: hypothetical protein FWF96_02780, partial [Kiritimatiellaeota bacterium]|nr:hypothetical protein [Kiritimatiellota bacterium]
TIETSPWYNHQAYLDTLDPDAVEAFIASTHEAYRKHLRADFGGVVPGLFTDEPFYMYVNSTLRGRPAIPWTPKLAAFFKRTFKYDLAAHLPELFIPFPNDAPSQTRWHYYDTLSQLFSDHFAKRIGEWCGENNLLFTGHIQWEANIITQTRCVGSAMRFYQHMHAPGVDILNERNREHDTVKQAVSVARQFSRAWRLSETDGGTGWDFSFAGRKALGDWQAALGINLRCPHLAWYSMQGVAKRDCPASIFYQSPWFAHYAKVENYFARVNVLLTRGAETRRILVVHPIESAWLHMAHGRGLAQPEQTAAAMIRLRDLLLQQHLDFDYGEETLLRDFGVLEKAPRLFLKDAPYDVVVIPEMRTLRTTTLDLLERFADAGGVIIWTSVPALVDAQPSDRAKKLAQKTIVAQNDRALLAALEPFRSLSIADPSGDEIRSALYNLREDADAAYLFVCETSFVLDKLPFSARELALEKPEASVTTLAGFDGAPLVRDRVLEHPDARITGLAGFDGAPFECDPETGVFYRADAKRLKDGRWRVKTSFPALGSRLFVFPRKPDAFAAKLPKRPHFKTIATRRVNPARWTIRRDEPNVFLLDTARVKIGGAAFREHFKTIATRRVNPARWTIRRDEPNVFLLDTARVKIGGAAFREPESILAADAAIRDALGVPRRSGNMAQPWLAKMDNALAPKKIPVVARCVFACEAIPDAPVWLGLECPEVFTSVTLNGVPVNLDLVNGWWCDASCKRVPLPAAFRKGENEIELRLDYASDFSGLENMFLLGEFGVALRGQPVLAVRPETLTLGDWATQGFPFYSASVQYVTTLKPPTRKKGQRIFARVPKYAGVAARVFVNGQCAGILAWAPNEVDITDFLPADNAAFEFAVEVISHRRNSHGPSHQRVPCGLLAAPVWVVFSL